MTDLFLTIVNMSLSATWLVLAVVVLRLVLKKAPKWVNVLLWGMVAVRLVCPVTVESVLSLVPSAQTISPDIMMEAEPSVNSGIEAVNRVVNPVIAETFSPAAGASANPLQIWLPIWAALWCIGMAAMAEYTCISYWRLRRRVRMAIRLEADIYLSEFVESPFVLGLLRPRIYLPYHMGEQDSHHVIAHERTHIRRKDHWWKPLGFALLTIHWFNPVMWLAYILLCRDIELACDEKVVKELGMEQRADYSQALLNCSVHRKQIAACPLAFGEVGVKERVKNVLSYQKPASWVILIAVTLCIVIAVCFLTDPVQPDSLEWLQTLNPETVEYIEYVNEQEVLDRQYTLYTGDDLMEAVTYLHNFNGTAVRNDAILPVESSGYQLNISTISGNHTVINVGNVYLVIDGDYYEDTDHILTQYWNAFFYGTTYLPAEENQELSVSMVVEDVSPTGITLHFENYDSRGELVLFGGNSYFLQEQVNGVWTNLPTLHDAVFTTESYSLSSIRRHMIDWEWLYGILPVGHYRIGKNVSVHSPDSISRQSYVVYAEFTLSEQPQPASPYAITSTLSAEGIRGNADFIVNGGGYTFFDEMEVQLVEILNALEEEDFSPSVGVDNPHTTITLRSEDVTLLLSSDEEKVEIAVEGDGSGIRWVVTSTPLNAFFAEVNRYSQANSTYEIYNTAPLNELSPYYTMEEAAIDKVVVTQNGLVLDNCEVWEEFWDDTQHGIPATVRCMNVSEGGSDIYDIEFDGEEYHYRTMRDGALWDISYRYLKFFNGHAPENAEYDAFEYFVLVNDDAVTWEQIQRSYISSQSADEVDHRIVHSHHIYYPKQPNLPAVTQAELTAEGETIALVTDEETVHEILQLINGAEWLGFEPATYFFGPRLMLLGEDGTAYSIDLDVTDDLCRFGERFYDYGPGMDGDASINNLPKLLALFGLEDWPEDVKQLYSYLWE